MMETMPATPASAPAPQRVLSPRVLSIDVLRGLTIALMVLVNDPGDWAHTYPQLDHASWNGFTLTDFVFPNFLFLVGASIIFSMQSRIQRTAGGTLDPATKKTLALHILRRALLLFAIKMALTAFPYFHYTRFRLYGVLTRIALCYLAAGLICLVALSARGKERQARALLAIVAALLLSYWALMRFVRVPLLDGSGFGYPTHNVLILDPDNNLAAWLDRGINAFTQRWLHTGRLYERTRDPEGLLSTLPAIATTLLGAITALYLRCNETPKGVPHDRREAPIVGLVSASPIVPEQASSPLDGPHLAPPHEASSRPERSAVERPLHSAGGASGIAPAHRLTGLIATGMALLATGRLWNLAFPINKNLWTSSYVLYAAGWSLLTLALCYWLIDIRRIQETRAGRWLAFPWLVFGSNAITAFVVSNFVVELMLWIKVNDSFSTTGKPSSAWLWTYRHLFARHGSDNVTSLAFALAFVALCFVPNWLLWRKRIFLKI